MNAYAIQLVGERICIVRPDGSVCYELRANNSPDNFNNSNEKHAQEILYRLNEWVS